MDGYPGAATTKRCILCACRSSTECDSDECTCADSSVERLNRARYWGCLARRPWSSCACLEKPHAGRTTNDGAPLGNRASVPHASAPHLLIDSGLQSSHRVRAASLFKVGCAYGDAGDTLRQTEFLERALAIQVEDSGPENYEVATTLAHLGDAYGHLGDASLQVELLEKALAIQEREYGSDHPEVANILEMLSVACGTLGDNERKAELWERAEAIRNLEGEVLETPSLVAQQLQDANKRALPGFPESQPFKWTPTDAHPCFEHPR